MSRRLVLAGGCSVTALGLNGNANAQGAATSGGLTVDYSQRDFQVVDYQFYEDPALPGIKLRGPLFDPAASRSHFTCLGAAQTLGVLVERPFPTILAERIGLPAWNVGIGGGNAGFFLRHPRLVELTNRGRFVVLQVMTARSERNDRLTPSMGAEIVRDEKYGDDVLTTVAWARIQKEEPENFEKYVEQSRAAWRENYRKLLNMLTVPVILFWFAPKKPYAPIDLSASSGFGMIDLYPQFVDGNDVDAVRSEAGAFVTCLSSRNTGYRLTSRFTGEPVTLAPMKASASAYSHGEANRNIYYPSPEMHEDAADSLEVAARRLAGQQ